MQLAGKVWMAFGVMALGVATCVAVSIDTRLPNYRVLLPAAEAKAAKGESVLEAIFRYRSTHGLFPMAIDDLVPELLPPADAEGWRLDWLPYVWSLTGNAGECVVRFTSHELGEARPRWEWQVSRDDFGRLDVRVDVSRLAAKWSRADARATMREFERRIAAADATGSYPGLAEHYQGAVGFLLEANLPAAAVAKCLEMRSRGLKPGWTEWALARARLAAGDGATAASELRRWATDHPSFTGFVRVAAFHRDAGDDAAAVDALRRAAELEVGGDTDSYVREAWYYSAAVMAYELGDFDLAVAICDPWERFSEARGYGEASYLVIRAAARIATGRFDAARADAQGAADRKRSMWAGDPGPVVRAAAAGDRAWRAAFPPQRLEIRITYE